MSSLRSHYHYAVVLIGNIAHVEHRSRGGNSTDRDETWLHPLVALTPSSRLLPSLKYTFLPITSLRIDKWAKIVFLEPRRWK